MMSSNREEIKNAVKNGAPNSQRSFESLSPSERERVLTQINTVGSRAEMHRFEAKQRDNETGMYKFP